MTRLRSALLGLLLPVLLIVWWELQGRAGRLPDYLPPPSLFMREWLVMAADGSLLGHTLVSLWRAMAGFVIGATCGALAGLMAAALRPVETFYDPIIALTYPIPKIAALPIIFAWFGLGDLSKIVIICVSVFYPLYVAMLSGARATPRAQILAARNMGAGPMRIILRVLLPSALPQLFDGLRIGLSLSFVVMFVAELMSSNKGLGYLIVHASDNHRFDLMFVSIVTIGMIGFVADRLLLAVRRRALVGQLAVTEFRR